MELPREDEFRHGIRYYYARGRRITADQLAAGRVHGDAMAHRGIYDGDIVVFQHSGFNDVETGRILLIDKAGGTRDSRACSLKRLVLDEPSVPARRPFEEDLDWDDTVVTLRCNSLTISRLRIEQRGAYKLRGVLLRSLRPWEARLMKPRSIPAANNEIAPGVREPGAPFYRSTGPRVRTNDPPGFPAS